MRTIGLLSLGLIAINLIFFSEAFRKGSTITPEAASQLGNFVGGYIGSYFLFLSVILLYKTLKGQEDANFTQSFEGKYFELIKIHRENTGELNLGEVSGQKVFVLMIREFREILKITHQVSSNCNVKLPLEKIREVAYDCFFYGLGPNSSRQLRTALEHFDKEFVEQLEQSLGQSKQNVKKDRNFEFEPFGGHQSRLGHYYRHLFQTVSYVDKQPSLNDKKKYEYIKIIRAQLSTHEQALLLLNCFTSLGSKWLSDKLVYKYKLVKNIPLDFFDKDTELNVHSLFEKGYFEGEDLSFN